VLDTLHTAHGMTAAHDSHVRTINLAHNHEDAHVRSLVVILTDSHFLSCADAGMATPDHTPFGRGYDTSLNYFCHCNDYCKLGPHLHLPTSHFKGDRVHLIKTLTKHIPCLVRSTSKKWRFRERDVWRWTG
jgi:hypothetical protein